MRNLGRHWRSTVVVVGVVVLAGTAMWQGRSHRTAMAQAGPDPLTRVERDAVRRVLKHLSLDRDALIALNLSSQQAESVLEEVRDWYLTNVAALASLKAAVDVDVTEVRVIEKAIRMGPYQAGRQEALAVGRQDLASSKASYDNAFSSLRTSVTSELSESQRSTWVAIQSGHGQQMPIRMLSLNDDQRVALGKVQRRHKWQRNGAPTAEDRTTAESTFESAKGQILTQDQQTVLSAYDGYYASSSGIVANALESVLVVEQ